MDEILSILEKNSRLSYEEIAIMVNKSVEEVKAAIEAYESDNVIIGYNTLINWEKTEKEMVTALIEVRVTLQKGEGFDKIAERIYKFDQVKSCYLMSGRYDVCIIIEGSTMKEIALFVSEKLAPMESVLSTATHFVLKKYKDKGMIFEVKSRDDRKAVIL